MPEISEDDARILRQMRDWQLQTNGTGMTNGPGGASQFVPPSVRRQRRALPQIATLPVGQYPGQFYGTIAANTAGFSYIFAVTAV